MSGPVAHPGQRCAPTGAWLGFLSVMRGALLTPPAPVQLLLGPWPATLRPTLPPLRLTATGPGGGKGGWLAGGAEALPGHVQGQQGPRGFHPDAPVGRLSWRPGPSPHAGRGLLPAERPAGRGPSPPPPPRPRPLAATHAQPLLVDGRTFLRSVLRGQWGAGLARGSYPLPGAGDLRAAGPWPACGARCLPRTA